jgi:hypothetical protein
MKKTILIPTDFTMESLNLFKYVMQTTTVDVHVIFLHCMAPSDSILDLLFTTSEDIAESLVSRDFKEAISIIKNRYGTYSSSENVQIFKGRTQGAFLNFLEGNKVDEIIVPKDYHFIKTNSRSIDPMSFIKDTTRSVIEVSWTGSKSVPEKNQLAELFNIAS